MNKIELLAPAGSLEKLKTSILFGADAVYCGGLNFGLRAGADNFSVEELKEGIEFAHQRDKKVYMTLNMIPHNEELAQLPEYIEEIRELNLDALIISDPGVFAFVKKEMPEMEIHISTQANNVNWASALFWAEQGAERIILARELDRDEIKEIAAKTEGKVELEYFVHGAMCISYSGRCLLSNYFVGRDANKGDCAQSCRWKYHLVEEKRPGEYYPIEENDQGTFIMNSRDLNLAEEIPELIEIGLSSLKIEGRMKSVHYAAAVVNTYRQLIDQYYADPENYQADPKLLAELRKISHRDYTKGFYYGKPGSEGQRYESSSYLRTYDFMGVVKAYDPEAQEAVVEVRNKIFKGDELEFIVPGQKTFTIRADYLLDEEGAEIEAAPHPKQLIKIPLTEEVPIGSLLRRQKEN
ncbi:peptidase U32 family protein [Halanaerobium congolense]|jgi:putative protease|uniref:peptidase U32 family protein n=1 Tax=Halanaerobium congolense TaxID=54121 RepID=UPI00079281DB|nr:U32 family peptidase [Halanaerobium congolense]KXS49126.1 MAG: putative protease [Halanaerobium sp. T82-1]TDP27045.1 putative protease [Halanaerobium congolense]SDG78420.1 putative protease [Halanaerobium congolense]SDK32094.1 putative protease [Halanaerobium congolense]SDL93691.1 putative protease [Halanaerobium congolense]